MAIVREMLWPLGAKRLVKRTTNGCVLCVKRHPEAAATAAHPYPNTAFDYAGPFTLLALFVCMATKLLSVHNHQDDIITFPPRAPHFDRLGEVAAMRHLRIVGPIQHHSQPLVPGSDDSEGRTALTPGHFIIGRPLTALTEPVFADVRSSQHLWQLWPKKSSSPVSNSPPRKIDLTLTSAKQHSLEKIPSHRYSGSWVGRRKSKLGKADWFGSCPYTQKAAASTDQSSLHLSCPSRQSHALKLRNFCFI
jgi:hypothetical protein